MHNRIVAVATALAFWLVAGLALAQRADRNTGGPTKNTLRMTVTEPTDGAAITGSLVRVVVGYNRDIFAGQGTHFGDPNFPQPRFNVYLDDELKTTLKGTESNVANLENVAPGSHKITVVALNVSGEVIDRKEINITTSAAPMPAARPVAEKVSEQPAPPKTYEAPVSTPPAEPPVTEAKALPKTASNAPRLALAGLALFASGLLIQRKARR